MALRIITEAKPHAVLTNLCQKKRQEYLRDVKEGKEKEREIELDGGWGEEEF